MELVKLVAYQKVCHYTPFFVLFMLSQQGQALYSGQQGVSGLTFGHLTFVHATFGKAVFGAHFAFHGVIAVTFAYNCFATAHKIGCCCFAQCFATLAGNGITHATNVTTAVIGFFTFAWFAEFALLYFTAAC
jgi:hypothetical protein